MSRLRWINFWPPTGHPDRPWLDDPDEDAFVRSSRGVCELYTEAVRPAGLQARHSELRLNCHHDEDRDDVLVEVDTDKGEGFERASATLPAGVAALPWPVRSVLALEVVHAAASRLGRERGWDQAVLDAARQHAVDGQLRYRWEGPAKVSPDRKLAAEPVFVMHDDGYGRVTVQIRRRDDEQPIAVSEPALAFSTSAGFARSAATLRWRGTRTVEIVPYAGLSAGVGRQTLWRDNRGWLTVDLDDPTTLGQLLVHDRVDVPAAMTQMPAVTVRTFADREPPWLGAGPSDTWGLRRLTDADHEYYKAQSDLGEFANGSEEWRAWWSLSGLTAVEFHVHFAFGRTDLEEPVKFRRYRGTLHVSGSRPHPGFASSADTQPRLQARDDVQALVDLVGDRLQLPPAPRLPDPADPLPELEAIRKRFRSR